MKNAILVLILGIFSATAHAGNLKDCVITKNGEKVKEIKKFHIANYETDQPEVDGIDGGLLDFRREGRKVKMTFSNECDNSYVFTFSAASIQKAFDGEYKKLIGHARVDDGGWELEFDGVVTCKVVN